MKYHTVFFMNILKITSYIYVKKKDNITTAKQGTKMDSLKSAIRSH